MPQTQDWFAANAPKAVPPVPAAVDWFAQHAPVPVTGVTGVPAVADVAPPPAPRVPTSAPVINPKTGRPVPAPVPFGESFLDIPAQGVLQAGHGVSEIAQSGVTVGPGLMPLAVGDPLRAARGASDVIRGGMGVALTGEQDRDGEPTKTAPMSARGVTDPSSVKVTQAPVKAPVKPPTMRAATAKERLVDTFRALGATAWDAIAQQPVAKVAGAVGELMDAGIRGNMGRADMTIGGKTIKAADQRVGAMVDLPGMSGGGLFSRVDAMVKTLPAKVHPNKLASMLRAGASGEELAFRKVPELLKAAGDKPISKAALVEHLEANPAPQIAVRTRTDTLPDFTRTLDELDAMEPELRRLRDESGLIAYEGDTRPGGIYRDQVERANVRGWAHDAANGSADARAKIDALNVSPETKEAALAYGRLSARSHVLNEEMLAAREAAQPKFDRYQVPGGENYRETLLTMPDNGAVGRSKILDQGTNPISRKPFVRFESEGGTYVVELNPGEDVAAAMQRRLSDSSRGGLRGQTFTSSHWDEPNVLAHSRSNDRTLPTGERGRFIEEVQSDWHQKGKAQGYRDAKPAPVPNTTAAMDESRGRLTQALWNDDNLGFDSPGEAIRSILTHDDYVNRWDVSPATRAAADEYRAHMASYDAARARHSQQANAVPDAPFKDSWPDLVLKQQLLDVAKTPDLEWIGFTGGKTQAARYDLSKQVSKVTLIKNHQGDLMVTANGLDGSQALPITPLEQKPLADFIGKEAASKLEAQDFAPSKKGSGWEEKSLSGLDLQVGGEGMLKFYDELLPKRLEKLVKPFGGKVERAPVMASDYPLPRTAGDRAAATMRVRNGVEEAGQTSPAWIVRLTPGMKAKILETGLPLMSLVMGAAVLPSAVRKKD